MDHGRGAMRWLPAGVGRVAVAIAVPIALFAPSAATLWVWSPDATDIQSRVSRLANSYGVILLNENEVPPVLADAVIATEDERFYSHHGVDSIGLARALLYDVVNVCLCQGGSTITQQLVKDLYLGGSDRGYDKLEDLALALKVERVLTKRQIMADYLSEITTGLGRRGGAGAGSGAWAPGLLAGEAGLEGAGRIPRLRRVLPHRWGRAFLGQPGQGRGGVEAVVRRHLDRLYRLRRRGWRGARQRSVVRSAGRRTRRWARRRRRVG